MISTLKIEKLKVYKKTIEIIRVCNTIDDIRHAINKLTEIEEDFPNIEWIRDNLEQTIAFTNLDSLIPDYISAIIEEIKKKIESLRNDKEITISDFLYLIFDKEEKVRLVLFYSDILILLLKTFQEGQCLLQYIKKGEETRDILILETNLTFERIDIKWILKEKDVEEKKKLTLELCILMEKDFKDFLINYDISSLDKLLNTFDSHFKNIFGKSINYEFYEKKKNLGWIENKIKENDKRIAQIKQMDNLEFFLTTTNKDLKKLTFIPLSILCESCKKIHDVIAKFDPEEFVGEYFRDGYIGFPKDNKIDCKCGHSLKLSTMRNQLEEATGKKIISNYEDDKKMVTSTSVEIVCPKCGQSNIAYGKFFSSPRMSSLIDKYWQERGAQPILKNKPFTCKCGMMKWDMKNWINETEKEEGMKLKY